MPWIRRRIIGQAEKIISACAIVKGKSNQYVRGNIAFAHLIIGVTDLCAFEIRGKIFLKQVMIFPQIPDPFVHILPLKVRCL